MMTDAARSVWQERDREALVVVETEKISLELEAPASGTLLRILVPDRTETAILSTIGIIGEPGEDISGLE